MKKQFLIVIFIFSFLQVYCGNEVESYRVIIDVPRSDQPDSIGYNVVAGLCPVIYDAVMKGQIKLWDSPRKEIQIFPTTLESIEKSSKTRFADCDNLYIHEVWKIGKKNIEDSTIGYEFVRRAPDKDPVAYGFVEYNDALITLKSNFAEPNADGYWYITFDQILKLRKFHYELFQFGTVVIKDADQSTLYKKFAWGNKEYSPVMEDIHANKSVTYSIEENHRLPGDKKLELGNLFLSNVEEFLNANIWRYYSLRGIILDDSMKFNPNLKLKVRKAEVTEIWNKNETYITFQPQTLVLYVNDTAMKPISMDELSKWDMVVDFKSMEDFFKEKQFFYIINKINNQPIERLTAYKYEKALLNGDWKAINRYVKDGF